MNFLVVLVCLIYCNQLIESIVPQAEGNGGAYFEKFELDYGSKDKRRVAGSLRGLLDISKISSFSLR